MKRIGKALIAISYSAAILLSMLIAASSNADAASTFQGAVVDADGKPAAGVFVTFTRTASTQNSVQDSLVPTAGGKPHSGRASSDQNGGFQVPNLPAGDYHVCVSVPPGDYVDGCKWSGVQRLSLLDNATLAGLRLVVTKGAKVRIHIQDPLQLMPSSGTVISGPRVIAGVQTSGGSIHVADVIARTPAGWDLAITVPTNVPLRLWLFSRELTIADQHGVQLNTTGPASGIVFAPGPADRDLTLRITGLAKPQP
jgi:hypothetical protein